MSNLLPVKKTLSRLYRYIIARASMGYIAGTELQDAQQTVSHLQNLGYVTTVGYWNQPGENPADVVSSYITAIDCLGKTATDCYYSIKAPAFDFDKNQYKAIVERSIQHDIPLHFDSLGHEWVDATFDLITSYPAPEGHVGCTLPGRWLRSVSDADRAISLKLPVRVVKGQWQDPENSKVDPTAGYMAVVERLAGKAQHVRIATHDPLLVKNALSTLLTADTDCELELLYGLPVLPALSIARDLKVPARIYVPYGQAFLPYCVSYIRKNPKTLLWLIKDVFSGPYLKRLPTYKGTTND